MKNLFTRTITGSLYVFFLIISLLAGKYTFAIFFFIVMLIAIYEFYNICEILNYNPLKIWGYSSAIITYLLSFLISSKVLPEHLFIYIVILFLLLFFIEMIFRFNNNNLIVNISLNILSFIYIVLPISLLPSIVFLDNSYSFKNLLFIFILIWVNDTMAYLVGISTGGRHKIHKEISPKKSWEGFFGGLLSTLIVSYILIKLNFVQFRNQFYIPALIVPIAGTTGDFFESLLKRKANIKDSGNILPGHGGVLDRIDSTLFIIPIIYIWLKFFIK